MCVQSLQTERIIIVIIVIIMADSHWLRFLSRIDHIKCDNMYRTLWGVTKDKLVISRKFPDCDLFSQSLSRKSYIYKQLQLHPSTYIHSYITHNELDMVGHSHTPTCTPLSWIYVCMFASCFSSLQLVQTANPGLQP